MTATIARVTYGIPPDPSDEYDSGESVSETGRLTDLLVNVYYGWKRGEIERPAISLGIGNLLRPETVEDIFQAMRLVEARG